MAVLNILIYGKVSLLKKWKHNIFIKQYIFEIFIFKGFKGFPLENDGWVWFLGFQDFQGLEDILFNKGNT